MEEKKTCEAADIWDTVMRYAEKSFSILNWSEQKRVGFDLTSAL